jgi:hypothetical protein
VITSRRDYILRIIDEISRLVARIVFKRRVGADQEALELVVMGFERLFNLERHQLFQFTPDQQFTMLTLDEPPEIARDKVLLYAALSDEAGRTYAKMGNERMALATYANALKFALKARAFVSTEPLPDFAPKIEDLVALVGEDRLDDETKALLVSPRPSP